VNEKEREDISTKKKKEKRGTNNFPLIRRRIRQPGKREVLTTLR